MIEHKHEYEVECPNDLATLIKIESLPDGSIQMGIYPSDCFYSTKNFINFCPVCGMKAVVEVNLEKAD